MGRTPPDIGTGRANGNGPPMWQATQQLQSRRLVSAQHLVAQPPLQCFDLGRRPVRDVGQRALLDLATLATGLPQREPGGDVRFEMPGNFRLAMRAGGIAAAQSG